MLARAKSERPDRPDRDEPAGQGNPSLVEDGLRIHLPCRKFHSPHLRATFSEPGKSLSTTFFGLIFGNFGGAIGFLSIAGVALSTALVRLIADANSETVERESEPLRST